MKKLSLFALTFIFVLMTNGAASGQTLYDSFSDGNFTANPVWTGTTGTWTVVPDSDVLTGAVGSNIVRLAATTIRRSVSISNQSSRFIRHDSGMGRFFRQTSAGLYGS